MRKIVVLVVLLLLGIPVWAKNAAVCGKERWPVKTLADAQAKQVVAGWSIPSSITKQVVPDRGISSSIAELASIPVPDRKTILQANAKRFPPELHRYKVTAWVLGYKLEADSDFHIVLADKDARNITGIGEIPSPDCAPEEYRQTFQGLRDAFTNRFGKVIPRYHKLLAPELVEVEGVGFIDIIHGQTGVARNGFELHPILSIRFGSGLSHVGKLAAVTVEGSSALDCSKFSVVRGLTRVKRRSDGRVVEVDFCRAAEEVKQKEAENAN